MTKKQKTIKQIEPKEARGKQFLCSLLKSFEVEGTSPSEWSYSRYMNEKVMWYYVNLKARALKKIGLEPQYITIDETLVSSYSNFSRTYAYCATLLRDFPKIEEELGGKSK